MIDAVHKVCLPHRPQHLVARPRLHAAVAASGQQQLVLLIAPAGYGKTSLLLDWAHATQQPLCWYSLDRYDADPHAFFACLVASLLQRFPARLPLTTALLSGGSTWSVELAVATLGREIADLGEAVLLVLDDWHQVDHVTSIASTITDLLRRAANLRVVLASRSYPSIPNMMLLTANGQVAGLAEHHLRFTAEEAAAVLALQIPRPLSSSEVAALTAKTNGWITGMLLMARSPGLAVPALGARSERQVYDFLAEQVFNGLDEDTRSFLLNSALLEELHPLACDRLLNRADSGRMLDRLMRQHLFVTELDNAVLRYHPLFREFLIERYRRDDRVGFQQTALRIADGYAADGLWAPAFDLCVLAGDLAAAAHMLQQGGDGLFRHGQFATLERCFEALPLERLSAPLLCIKGRLQLNRGAVQEAAALGDLASGRMREGELVIVRLFQATVAQHRGEYQEAIALIEELLEHAPSAEQRAQALAISASCHGWLGALDVAVELTGQALQIQRGRGDLYHLALLSHDMGLLHEQANRLREAERCYQQADGYWTTLGNIGSRALSRNSCAVILHMLGRFREAHSQLLAALQDAQSAQTPTYEAAIHASLGDLYCDLGLWELAERSYQQARDAKGSGFIQGYVEVAALWPLVRQGRYGAAGAGLDRLEPRVASRHAAAVTMLRVAIASGQRRFEQAERLLRERLLVSATPSAELARGWVWLASVRLESRPPDTAGVVAALDQALACAAQLGHDASLVAELAQHPSLMRQAAAYNWAAVDSISGRVAEIQILAQRISGQVGVPILTVRALGGDGIDVDGTPIPLGQRKAREVLYYLLAHPQGATVDEVREALWPEREETSSRHLLHTAVRFLRSALPDNLISIAQRRTYQLEHGVVQLRYDVDQFLRQTAPTVHDPELLAEAIELYRGSYLPWCDSDWCEGPRALLERRFVEAVHRAGGLFEQQEQVQRALAMYGRALALDPLDERAAAGVMRCHLALGNRAAAIDSYQRTRQQLSDDLGLEPDPSSELEQIYLEICKSSP